MKKLIALIFAANMILWGAGCNSYGPVSDSIQYPYYAPPERANQIIQTYPTFKPGMTQDEVVKLLGQPEEKNQLYNSGDHFESRQSDGEVWIYIVQRVSQYGGSLERKEKSVRIEFNLDKKITRIEPMGISGASAMKNKKSRTGIPGSAY